MKNIKQTSIDGVLVIENFNTTDGRGKFVKTFHVDFLKNAGIDFQIAESYFSYSKKDTIRGMHFQTPPYDHQKLVYVPKGKIIDVIVDLRRESSSYKKNIAVELGAENHKAIYIPKGCAHGFRALEDDTIVVYSVGTVYNPQYDKGVHFDSFGFNWGVENPTISERDANFPTLEVYLENNLF